MKIKKTVCILLILSFVLSLLPGTVFAEDTHDNTRQTGNAEDYVLVQQAPEDWSGTYLLVYETGEYAFNGGLSSPYVSGNYISLALSDGIIRGSEDLDDVSVTLKRIDETEFYSIQLAGGKYIGNTGSAAGINAAESKRYPNAISLDENGNAVISNVTEKSTYYFRFNSNTSSNRFSFFGATTGNAIKLYRRNSCVAHIYDDGIVTVAADCQNDGEMTYTCAACGDTYTETIPAGHMPIMIPPVEATCTESGLTAGTRCAICEEVLTAPTIIPAKGHEEEPEEELEATCTDAGSTGGTYCAVCGAVIESATPIEALGHDYIYVPESLDSHWKSCSRCDEEVLENCTFSDGICVCGNVESGNHSYVWDGNSGADGYHTLFCDHCGDYKSEACAFENGVCTVCGAEEPTEEIGLKIISAYLTLDEDIDVTYTANIPDGCTDVYMRFTMNGQTTDVADDGSHIFVFEGVKPYAMGDNICAVLYATYEGKTVSNSLEEYSARQYCVNTLERYSDDGKLVTLLSDLLTYGAAAQTYNNYKTDNLVTDGLSLTPSTFSDLSDLRVSFSGEKSAAADWISEGLILSNDLAVRIAFSAASTQNLTVKVELNGRTKTYDQDDFVSDGSGRYYVDFYGIKAAEFADTVSASFFEGDTQIGRTVNYTVNTYICSTQNNTSVPNLSDLVRALYCYGASAAGYTEKDLRSAKRGTIPARYNSNEKGYITPVRSQSPYATCWTHGNMGACEASMVRNRVPVGDTGMAATTSLNLSEYHIAWFSATNSYDALGMTNGDSTTPLINYLDGAGNDVVACYTLMRWEGLASESTSALAYSKVSSSGIDPKYAYDYDVAHVQDVIFIPVSNRDEVKQAIMACGGGTFNYYHDTGSCNMTTGSYCYTGTEAANHDVLVVGWDDNYSRNNFKHVPEGDGAWIVKGSWGARYGEDGYFFISYYDTTSSAGSCMFYQVEAVDNYDYNYQYDGTPNATNLSKKAGVSVCNVFTANGNETLRAVSAASATPGISYNVKIYKGVSSTTNPAGGVLAAEQNGTFAYKGYHTVELNTPVALNKGERFSVVFTFDGSETIQVPVDKTGSNAFLSWTHQTHPNTSYYKSASVKSWTNYSATGSFRIKAYTDKTVAQISASSADTSKGTVSVSGNVITAAPKTGYYASGYTVLSGTASVEQNGDTFIVTADQNCSIRINFAAKQVVTMQFYVNGTLQESKSGYLGDSIALPRANNIPIGCDFYGWTTQNLTAPTTAKPTAYAAGEAFVLSSGCTRLYALLEFTQNDEGDRTERFIRVTEEKADWTGEYIFATAEAAAAAKLNAAGTYLDSVQLSVSDGEIFTTNQEVVWTIEQIGTTGTYTIQNSEGKYLKCTASKSVQLVNEAGNNCAWTIGVDRIAPTNASLGSLQRNRSLSRITVYSSAQETLQLYVGKRGTVFYATAAPTETAHIHTLIAAAAQKATCTETGNKAYWHCSDCGKYFSDAKATTETSAQAVVLSALGHSFLYTDNGSTHVITCSRCSYRQTQQHSFSNGECICGAEEVKNYSGRYYIAAVRSGDNGVYQYLTSDTASSRYVITSSGVTTLPASISKPDANKVFVISRSADGSYRIQAEGRTDAGYLSWGSGNTGSFSANGNAVKIIENTDGTYQIRLADEADGVRYLAFNSTATNLYAAWYKTGTKNLRLIPVSGTAAHTHSYTSKTTAPTCTVAGYTTYTCACGSSYTADRVAALGHNLTYTDLGTMHRAACSRCAYSTSQSHSYTNGACICGASSGNDYSGRYYIAALRSGDNGVYQYLTDTLTNSRYTIVSSGCSTLPAGISKPESGKVFVITKRSDGSYSIASEAKKEAGYLSWTSGNTGAFSATEALVEITAANDGAVTIMLKNASDGPRYLAFNSTAANMYAAWYKSGTKNLYLIPVMGSVSAHTHKYTASTVAPTCTEQGYTLHTCSCGDSYKDKYIAALGHNLTYSKTTTGHKESCGRCSYSITAVHSYTAGVCVCGATDFSGTYYIAGLRSGDSGVYQYLTSDITSSRYNIESSGKTVLPTGISNPAANKTFIITANTDGSYTVTTSGGEYLTWTSGNTGTLSTKSRKVNIVAGPDGTVNISLSSCSDGPRYLAMNSTASNRYAAWYKSGMKNLYLIPVQTASH